jgi:hypothetical protein
MTRASSVLLLLLLLAAGCRNRLNMETKVTADLANKEYRTIDPISREQKVSVAATAASGMFNICIYLEKDKADAEKAAAANKSSPKLLALETKVATKVNFAVNVPANERAVVMITSGDGKKTEVNLKITN